MEGQSQSSGNNEPGILAKVRRKLWKTPEEQKTQEKSFNQLRNVLTGIVQKRIDELQKTYGKNPKNSALLAQIFPEMIFTKQAYLDEKKDSNIGPIEEETKAFTILLEQKVPQSMVEMLEKPEIDEVQTNIHGKVHRTA